MKVKEVEMLWTPVARGKIYCSLACGAGCTRASHDLAQRGAARLVKRLRGDGWKPVVWECLGWRYKAVSWPLEVMGCSPSGYACSLGQSGELRDRDPNQLVARVLESERLRLSKEIEQLRKACAVSGRVLDLPPSITIWNVLGPARSIQAPARKVVRRG